jgi:hypothetical protein
VDEADEQPVFDHPLAMDNFSISPVDGKIKVFLEEGTFPCVGIHKFNTPRVFPLFPGPLFASLFYPPFQENHDFGFGSSTSMP